MTQEERQELIFELKTITNSMNRIIQLLDEKIEEDDKEFLEESNENSSGHEDSNLEIKVTKLIREFGIPANIKGYYYIREALITSYENPSMMEMITKKLYPSIARTYETTPSRVERAIRHAIEISATRGNRETWANLFGYIPDSKKKIPSNSEFIAILLDYLRVYKCV